MKDFVRRVGDAFGRWGRPQTRKWAWRGLAEGAHETSPAAPGIACRDALLERHEQCSLEHGCGASDTQTRVVADQLLQQRLIGLKAGGFVFGATQGRCALDQPLGAWTP